MKLRNGFVSNSSSSSFTCNVCHATESGWDASPSDFEMITCANDHCFCTAHMKNKEEFKKLADGETTESEYSTDYEIDPKFCPICSMETIEDDDLLKYLMVVFNVNRKDLNATIRDTFKTYADFQAFIKKAK